MGMALQTTGMEIGIVGGGVAGIGAAYELRDADATITLLEKGYDIGGRVATRVENGCVYDHGANYLTPDEELEELVRGLGSDGLVEIEKPVWTFDSDGRVSEGEGEDRDRPAITYEDGIVEFPKRVLSRVDATLETGSRAETIVRDGDRWRVRTGGGKYDFDALVLTPPAPRTAALLSNAEWHAPLREELIDAAEAVPFRTIVSAVLHYPFEMDRPYYALVNTDRDHEIGWLSREECKRGHVPDGESLLVVQMAPDWSVEWYDDPADRTGGRIAELAAALLDAPRLESPDWTDRTQWRHALPGGRADPDTLTRAEERSLYFAGDWVVGNGRIAAAFENGREVGGRIRR